MNRFGIHTMWKKISFLLLPLVMGIVVLIPVAWSGQKSATTQPARRSVLIEGIPHIQQRPDFCGEACLAMWSEKSGYKVSQNWVFNASGLSPELGRGCYAPELYRAMVGYGLNPGTKEQAWAKIDPQKAAAELNAQFDALLADLYKGIGSIVCMHYDDSPDTTEHFRLILGYDADTD